MTTKINWEKVWDKFDIWFGEQKPAQRCKTCGLKGLEDVEWEEQQKKIQQLISAQVRELVKKKI